MQKLKSGKLKAETGNGAMHLTPVRAGHRGQKPWKWSNSARYRREVHSPNGKSGRKEQEDREGKKPPLTTAPSSLGCLLSALPISAFPHAHPAAVGHRVVHGGPKHSNPQLITQEMVEELRQLTPFDPEHLPEENIFVLPAASSTRIAVQGTGRTIANCTAAE